jgi:Leucine-rich repeat (LRR) protein
VHGTKASDTTIDHISGITMLESLNMGSNMVTDIGMDRLTALPNLKELTLGGNKIDDIGWQSLRQMPNLTYLDIGGRQGTDANIWAVKMSDTGVDALLSLKKLRDLRFACTSVGSGLEGAKFADVRYVSVTTEWIQKLKALPNLERLQLESCDRVTDDSVKALAALPAIKELDLKGTKVTEKGAAELKAAKPGIQLYFGVWEAKAANFRNN